jgi:glutathione S-transferase
MFWPVYAQYSPIAYIPAPRWQWHMDGMRILYHLPLSPFSRKVRLALAEKRIPFELRLEKVWDQREEFLAMNPAGTVPVLAEENGLTICDSSAICEYLDEAYPDISLYGRTLAERAEVRRLVAWFDLKFGAEVTQNLVYERHLKRSMGRGNPDAANIRAGYAAIKPHLEHIGWLAESRTWLAGAHISLADFAAAAHLSVLDYANDVDWKYNDPAREWYARIKSRPAFRPLLTERVSGLTPPSHYDDLDF